MPRIRKMYRCPWCVGDAEYGALSITSHYVKNELWDHVCRAHGMDAFEDRTWPKHDYGHNNSDVSNAYPCPMCGDTLPLANRDFRPSFRMYIHIMRLGKARQEEHIAIMRMMV